MFIAFLIWTLCAGIFLAIGISSYKSKEPVGFFSFSNPPKVNDVEGYNKAVAKLWFVVSVIFEILGIPFLFLEQNSPEFFIIVVAVPALVIGMVIAYLRIEAKYKKK